MRGQALRDEDVYYAVRVAAASRLAAAAGARATQADVAANWRPLVRRCLMLFDDVVAELFLFVNCLY